VGLALPLEFISQPREVSGKDLLALRSVLQDPPVIPVDVFHGALIARSERCSARGLLDCGQVPTSGGQICRNVGVLNGSTAEAGYA
jgi:hypothetical protein